MNQKQAPLHYASFEAFMLVIFQVVLRVVMPGSYGQTHEVVLVLEYTMGLCFQEAQSGYSCWK